MAVKEWVVYRRFTEGTVEVARIVGEVVTGSDAESIEKLLKAEGFPELDPLVILHGMYLWAARVGGNPESLETD